VNIYYIKKELTEEQKETRSANFVLYPIIKWPGQKTLRSISVDRPY
jgi:hypothetical protein